MDSINTNQAEANHKDLFGKKGIDKMKELIKKASTCFFCTQNIDSTEFVTRPMAVQQTEEDGTLWFLSASDSLKNNEIENDSRVRLLFQGDPHSDFLSLSGDAMVTRDKNIIRELWNPMLKTWFTEGIDDPRITAIRVKVREGYYWDTKHSTWVAFIKQFAGAIAGKTLDDSIEGIIQPANRN